MRWVTQDIEMFMKSKEYIDTAVIPLLPISFADDMKNTACSHEFISMLSVQVERQFHGRLLMLPSHTYLTSLGEEELVRNLSIWEEKLLSEGFKYIFYFTSDSLWKSHENQLKGDVLWLPSLPLEQFDESQRNSIMEDQVKQLVNLFMQKWQKED
ncbi:YpiF family protein [Bacillus sp. Bva_UNVM-123]|uniref:YpiF family protein n=1 Tax=Bacillus sp. Bva_UNVM-123 TaxID=2829798 RepID=UPI00391F0ED3